MHVYLDGNKNPAETDEDNILVKTVRLIKKNEELTINYNGDWNDKTKIWFEVK